VLEIWINIGEYSLRSINHFESFFIGITGFTFTYLIDRDELLDPSE
jgi:hypothetical protein